MRDQIARHLERARMAARVDGGRHRSPMWRRWCWRSRERWRRRNRERGSRRRKSMRRRMRAFAASGRIWRRWSATSSTMPANGRSRGSRSRSSKERGAGDPRIVRIIVDDDGPGLTAQRARAGDAPRAAGWTRPSPARASAFPSSCELDLAFTAGASRSALRRSAVCRLNWLCPRPDAHPFSLRFGVHNARSLKSDWARPRYPPHSPWLSKCLHRAPLRANRRNREGAFWRAFVWFRCRGLGRPCYGCAGNR